MLETLSEAQAAALIGLLGGLALGDSEGTELVDAAVMGLATAQAWGTARMNSPLRKRTETRAMGLARDALEAAIGLAMTAAETARATIRR